MESCIKQNLVNKKVDIEMFSSSVVLVIACNLNMKTVPSNFV